MSITNPELLSTVSSDYSSLSETLKMEILDHHMKLVCDQLNEKQRRWVAGLLSEGLGWGGTKRVAKATGLDPKTIRQGRLDLAKNLNGYIPKRVRGIGAGRPPLKKKEPTLEKHLVSLVEPETGGDPEDHCKYTRSSLRSLAKRLGCASATTVGHLLKSLGYSLKTNVKRLIGKPHPQRDRQYRLIQRYKSFFLHHKQPVVSIDAKKAELIGNFKNHGTRYCKLADEVNTYDFPSEAKCKAIPYGIYDQEANHALVMVGKSANTAMFAVNSIRCWWQHFGSTRYPNAKHLLLLADSGGSNGHRPRLWKWELQKLANESHLMISVCHYPPGASKWNPIEHRVFSQISRNWFGHPLRTLSIMLNFLRGTTTEEGLSIDAKLDSTIYEKGISISKQEMKSLNIHFRKFCPNLNYTIKPQKSGNN